MSTCVLVDLSGQIIAKGTGPGTNHFLTGMNECRKRIVEMINGLKKEKGISVDTPLLALVNNTFMLPFIYLTQYFSNPCFHCSILSTTVNRNNAIKNFIRKKHF